MKKLICTLVFSSLVSVAAPAMAAAPPVADRAAITQLTVIEAHKTMLGLCGITGDEAAKYLAKDNENEAKLEATLSDDGKKSLAQTLALLDGGIKASWDQTPEAQRTQSCEALKTALSKE